MSSFPPRGADLWGRGAMTIGAPMGTFTRHPPPGLGLVRIPPSSNRWLRPRPTSMRRRPWLECVRALSEGVADERQRRWH
jgi:hypothetical protein